MEDSTKTAFALELLRLHVVGPDGALSLVKSAEITADDARRSLDRLDTLERNRPTLHQVGRYGALGAAGGGLIGAVGNAIEHGGPLKGATPKAKALNLAANTAKGALSGGAIPLARSALDRRAEVGTLRRFVQEGDGVKVGAVALEVMKQAGLGDLVRKVPQAVRALPGAAKNVALGAGERNMHLNEVAGLGVLAVPGIDTIQSRVRARLAGDKSEHGAERRQFLGEGAHAALDVGGLGLLAAPAIGHLKHAYESFASVPYSAYGGKQAENPPGMRGRSQLPAFVAPELAVKQGGAFRRVGELVTGSKAGRLRDAAARGTGARRKELLSMARREEGNVGKVQGALAAGAAIGAVKDTGELVAGAKDKLTKKEAAGMAQRLGELLSGRRARELTGKAKSLAGEASKLKHLAPTAPHGAGKYNKSTGRLLNQAARYDKASDKVTALAGKERTSVGLARAGAGALAAGGALAASRKKEAGIGVGSSMTASQYSGPLSYGPFKMTSGIPAFTSPAMTKGDPNAEPEAWAVGGGKTASMAATGAMSPAGKLTASQRVGAPKTTGFAGPSVADIAKPKGFGTPLPGAQKNQL